MSKTKMLPLKILKHNAVVAAEDQTQLGLLIRCRGTTNPVIKIYIDFQKPFQTLAYISVCLNTGAARSLFMHS